MNKKNYKIAQKAYNSKNLFNIVAYIEQTITEEQNRYFKDLIYLEFIPGTSSGYNNNARISIKYSATELRSLSYALKELYKLKESNYVKFADASLSSETPSNDKKKITLLHDSNKNFYYINISQGSTKIGIEFDRYSILAKSDEMGEIAALVDSSLYRFQRENEKQLNRKSNNMGTSA